MPNGKCAPLLHCMQGSFHVSPDLSAGWSLEAPAVKDPCHCASKAVKEDTMGNAIQQFGSGSLAVVYPHVPYSFPFCLKTPS